MKIKFLSAAVIISSLIVLAYGFSGDEKSKLKKSSSNDLYNFIAINNILMWFSNNGEGSHDPRTDGNGLYWPGGINGTKYAIFQDGLMFAAKVDTGIRAGGNYYRAGLQAGKVINGIADDPGLEKYRIYKITRGWENLPEGNEKNQREKDYLEWPIEDGAPYEDINNDGKPTPGVDKPKFIGDETLWYVSNDFDTARTKSVFGSESLGLEIQTTVYGYKKYSILGDVVFKRYRLINKGEFQLRDMYLGMWCDPDLGDPGDDFVGCDTLLNLAYAWNSDNTDGDGIGGTYGVNPPAAGYTILQGPIVPGASSDSALFMENWIKGIRNLETNSFIPILKHSSRYDFNDLWQGNLNGTYQLYNYFQGLTMGGNPIIDPITGMIIKKAVYGDPESGTGWYEGLGWPETPPPPGDRRMLISSGPFTLAPGDTQEVVYAIHLSRGNSNINSVTQLKKQSAIIKRFYDSASDFLPLPEAPVFNGVPQDSKIMLWWENNSEKFSSVDPLLPDTVKFNLNGVDFLIPVTTNTYNFEGYRLWQVKDSLGTSPLLLNTFDLKNDINKIYEFPLGLIDINHLNNPTDPRIFSPDEGLRRHLVLTDDKLNNAPFYNGREYYFGITAYAYSKFSDPPFVESEMSIVKVIPGLPPIDAENKYSSQGRIDFEHTAGSSDGEVYARIIDPEFLTGDTYELFFNRSENLLTYSLKNLDSDIYPLFNHNDINSDSLDKIVTEGFILVVNDTNKYKVKSVQEIKGPAGTNISPLNVFSTSTSVNLNSTGKWTIKLKTVENEFSDRMELMNLGLQYYNSIRPDTSDYEIRFTQSGSEYLTFSARRPEDAKISGKGRVPFEVWKLPHDQTKAPVKMGIAVKDQVFDSSWSKIDDYYEPFYAYEPREGFLPWFSVKLSGIVINGELPEAGTIIAFKTSRMFTEEDKYSITIEAPVINKNLAKDRINNISVFPNPYFAASASQQDYPQAIRFTSLPQKFIIRIFSLAGVFINKFEVEGEGQYFDWDLKNKNGEYVGSGMYLAYVELPGIGTKVIKIAVVK